MNLKKIEKPLERKGPVVLIVMDGMGEGIEDESNAVHLANTPTLDRLKEGMHTSLKAHGTAVGLPSDDDMGNSEVGHNAIGAGRIFAQGARLVEEAFESGGIFGLIWQEIIENTKRNDSALHFLGLLSDGNVHSHERHLHQMLLQADKEGIKQVNVHILLDGRDVSGRSALIYIERLEKVLAEINQKEERDYKIASGGGRMLITMDRYEADWSMVELGWKTHVLGEGRQFASATQAIETLRKEDSTINDQYIPPFIIAKDGLPIGKVNDNDGVIFFNFRGDRGIEICRAFEEEIFEPFDRSPRPQKLCFAGMMEYDGDLHIPSHYLVAPPSIDKTMGEYLCAEGVFQFAISETQKFGHVTYFWNGNRSGKFNDKLENYVEIPSDLIPFEDRPWMKAAQVTDRVIEAILSNEYQFLRLNFANGDMVGHTGDLYSTIIAVEVVDLCLSRILKVIDDVGGIALITADHGNADEMYEHDKQGLIKRMDDGSPKIRTSHTLNKVPFFIYDPHFSGEYELASLEQKGLSNIASTAMNLLGFYAPDDYQPSLIHFLKK